MYVLDSDLCIVNNLLYNLLYRPQVLSIYGRIGYEDVQCFERQQTYPFVAQFGAEAMLGFVRIHQVGLT